MGGSKRERERKSERQWRERKEKDSLRIRKREISERDYRGLERER